MKFIRNAFVHTNSDLTNLSPPWLGKTIDDDKGMPADIAVLVENYCNDVNAGNVTDDSGNIYSDYYRVDNGVVKLLDNSALYMTALGNKLFHRHRNALQGP